MEWEQLVHELLLMEPGAQRLEILEALGDHEHVERMGYSREVAAQAQGALSNPCAWKRLMGHSTIGSKCKSHATQWSTTY